MALRERGDLLERRKTFSLDRAKPNISQFIHDRQNEQPRRLSDSKSGLDRRSRRSVYSYCNGFSSKHDPTDI